MDCLRKDHKLMLRDYEVTYQEMVMLFKRSDRQALSVTDQIDLYRLFPPPPCLERILPPGHIGLVTRQFSEEASSEVIFEDAVNGYIGHMWCLRDKRKRRDGRKNFTSVYGKNRT